jgi:hypothetical protein
LLGEYGQRWGMSFHKRERVSKRGPRGKLIMGINSTHFLNFIIIGDNFYFLFECMRAQSLNSCKRVGVRVTSHSYWKHGDEVQSTLGRVSSQLSWENRGNSYGELHAVFTHSVFGMNNKQRAGKKSTWS